MSLNKFESFLFEKVRKSHLPSASAAVVKGDEVIWSGAVGYRDLENGLAATPTSLYGIGSVTKSFTAVAILQLAEQGKLKLDDPVEKYLPDFKIRPSGEAVRLRHFLSHTSGIPALAYAECFIDGVTGEGTGWLPISSASDMIAFLDKAGDWTLNKPGERWFYLNEGYFLLAAIVEKLSGKSFIDYVHDCIFAPLGMERSYFRKADIEKDGDLALPYLVMQDGKRQLSHYPYGLTGDGGILSNVLDMAKYVGMYLGWGKKGDAQILTKASVEEMQTPRVKTPPDGNPFGDYRYAYGLGVLDNFLGEKLVGHSGSVGVSTAYMGFIPGKQLGVVVLANGSGYAPSQMGQYALAEALGKDPDELPFVRREQGLEALEGNYETYKGTTKMQVKAAGDFITLVQKSRYGTNTIVLIPENGAAENGVRKFYTLSAGTKLPVEFRVNDGQVEFVYERYLLRRTGKLA